MRFLLLFLLQFSFVHRSLQLKLDESEVVMDLKEGFPPGSLLTVYLHYTNPAIDGIEENSIDIDLYEDFEKGIDHNMHFRIDGRNKGLLSNYRHDVRDQFMFPIGPIWRGLKHPIFPNYNNPKLYEKFKAQALVANRKSWLRFDLYKADNQFYIPFLDGFAGFPIAMNVTGKTTSVHIKRTPSSTGLPLATNFDKDSVHISLRLPNDQFYLDPELVLFQRDRFTFIKQNPGHTNLLTLNSIPIGTTIRMSILLPASILDKTEPTLYFFNSKARVSFGFWRLRWEGSFQCYFFYSSKTPEHSGWNRKELSIESCWSEQDGSAKDLLHIILTRRNEDDLAGRVLYAKDDVNGIDIGFNFYKDKNFLDGPFQVYGTGGATLLHMIY